MSANCRKIDIFILVFVVAAVFGSSIGHEFVWDDHVVVKNKKFETVEAIPWMFSTADSTGVEQGNPYYRPVTYLSFFVDNQLFGNNQSLYHFEQVLWHIAAVLSLYLLLQAVFGHRIISFVATSLFALHPVVVEPVNFIAARNNIICLIFMLLSLACLVAGTRRLNASSKYGMYGLSAVAYLIAMLAKEPGALLILFVSFALFPDRSITLREKLRVAGLFAIASGVYLVLRYWALGSTSGVLEFTGDPELIIMSLYYYFKLVLWPIGLHPLYIVSPEAISGFQSLIAVIGFLALVALAIKRRGKPEGIGALWLLVCFLPLANIIPIPSSPVADRYMYIPLPGFALIVAVIFQWVYLRYKKIALLVAVPVLVSLAFLSSERTDAWANNSTLWRDVTVQEPGHSIAYYNLGLSLKGKGDDDEVFNAFSSAVEKDPSNFRAHIALGLYYRQTGQLNLAVKSYQRALLFDADNITALYNLGNVYAVAKENRLAVESYLRVVEIDPGHSDAYYNLASILRREGQFESALKYAEAALKLNPDDAGFNFLVAKLYLDKGEKAAAQTYLQQTLKLDPEDENATNLLRTTGKLSY
jgi:Tfp pilus assembly protein PilF